MPMTKNTPQIPSILPTPDQIISFLESVGGSAKKADIAKHFDISGHNRIALKQILRTMLDKRQLEKGVGLSVSLPSAKFLVVNATVTRKDDEGLLVATFDDDHTKTVTLLPTRRPELECTLNDAVVVRLNPKIGDDTTLMGYVLRVIGPATINIVGEVRMAGQGYSLQPIDRKWREPVTIPHGSLNGARAGDMVKATVDRRFWAKVTDIIGQRDTPGLVSLLMIYASEIPCEFPQAVLDETEGMVVPPLNSSLGNRYDLRDTPLVTIDGADARDFDDAVYAAPHPEQSGWWNIVVAIADVAHYVRPDSALDKEAYKRGNSCYFPDRVVPMLPEALSNGLCSLVPHQERACMAALMTVDSNGALIEKRVVRGLMKSAARLTYEQVQEALDGHLSELTTPILDSVIKPLKQVFNVLLKARQARGTVDLEIPERKVLIENGEVKSITPRARLASHQIIEELMILANVAVAELLTDADRPTLYRVHDQPDSVRLDATRDFLKLRGLKMPTGNRIAPRDLQEVVKQTDGRDDAVLIQEVILRTMAQANYNPDNIGHFGLALADYAHFTSPIRRYADLVVHRGLIELFGLGDDGITHDQQQKLGIVGEHISQTERRAAQAEREALERYVALYLQTRRGEHFPARISGVTSAGLFLRLTDLGAEGFIPMRSLNDDFYVHVEASFALIGTRTGRMFQLSQPVIVQLDGVEPLTNQVFLSIAPESPNFFGDRPPPRTSSGGGFKKPFRKAPAGDGRRSDDRPSGSSRDGGSRPSSPFAPKKPGGFKPKGNKFGGKR